MPNRRWRRASAATAALCVIVGGLTGCDAPARDQMTTLLVEHELPYLGSTAAIRGVADWRRLTYPTAAIRADFTSNEMTYRVISASPNQAELAVWLIGQPGGEPFNSQADVTATAHGCVLIRRASAEATVTSTVRDCPADLVTTPPLADNASWARDSKAVAAAQRLVDSTTTPRLVSTSTVEVGGKRREPPTRDALLAAARVDTSEGQTVATLAPRQPRGRFVADLVATATGPDALDNGRTIGGRRCYRIDFALSVGMDATTLPRPVDCR